MGKFIDEKLNLLAIDRRRYNARSISGHASDNQQMLRSILCGIGFTQLFAA
jgi:hypothetical protein